jgi:hypothetical protein
VRFDGRVGGAGGAGTTFGDGGGGRGKEDGLVVGRAGGGGSCDEGTAGADTFPTVAIRLHLMSGISKSDRGEKPKLRIDIDIYDSYFDARIRPNSIIGAHLED